MSEVTVQVQQPLTDFADGEVVTLERTPFVDRLIAAGRVVPVTVETTTVQNFGQTVVAEIPVVVPERPTVSATKAAWAAYADVVQIDTSGLTKEQIIAAVDASDRPAGDLDGLDEFADHD